VQSLSIPSINPPFKNEFAVSNEKPFGGLGIHTLHQSIGGNRNTLKDSYRWQANEKSSISSCVSRKSTISAHVEDYRRLGWSEDEDDRYYQYRMLDQTGKNWGWPKVIDILAWLSCGYGVRPGYALAWSLLTILAFGLAF
jgi:hypothetical protein